MLGGVEIANNSHDIFIDLLAKTGVVGLGVLLIGLLGGLCGCCARRLRPHACSVLRSSVCC